MEGKYVMVFVFYFMTYTLFHDFNGNNLCEIDAYLINNQITIIEDGS